MDLGYRLLCYLRLLPSPSRKWANAGLWAVGAMKRGMDETGARRAELLAAGMPPGEAQAVMLREMYADPGFHIAMAHAEGVVRRSFPGFDDPARPGAARWGLGGRQGWTSR